MFLFIYLFNENSISFQNKSKAMWQESKTTLSDSSEEGKEKKKIAQMKLL